MKPQLVRADFLRAARWSAPQTILLEFEDGYDAGLDVARLDMPLERIRWETADATEGALVVIATDGERIPIDGASVRCLVDERYKAGFERAYNTLRLSRAELRELTDNEPRNWK